MLGDKGRVEKEEGSLGGMVEGGCRRGEQEVGREEGRQREVTEDIG